MVTHKTPSSTGVDERVFRQPALEMNFKEALAFYGEGIRVAAQAEALERKSYYRWMGFTDLFFLGVYIMGREDMLHPWIYERCREVQKNPDGHLDLWAREHYKSTIITFLLTVQDILNDPEVTIAIFSHTRPIAKGFMRQIKQELENNVDLKYYFDDVLYESPKLNAPRWSEDGGLVVKRRNNPKEATLEAWGLVDGMPTSKHFKKRVYDDIVTQASVTSPEMVSKTDTALALSVDLGTEDGVERYIGTRYAEFDSYKSLIDKGLLITRQHPACPFSASDDGKRIIIHFDKAVFRSPDWLRKKYQAQGAYVFGCQQLQNPSADQTKKFSLSWLKFWDVESQKNQNLCIIVDPASGKGRQSQRNTNDYTTMLVIGRGADDVWRVHDGIRDRLNLTERCNALMELHQMYDPLRVFYEDYGMQADIEHIKYVQRLETYEFEIYPLGGSMSKGNRIMRLMPMFEFGRVIWPKSLIRTSHDGKAYNLTNIFIKEEYDAFPVMKHDDIIDSLARIEDEEVKRLLPRPQPERKRAKAVEKALRAQRMASRPVV